MPKGEELSQKGGALTPAEEPMSVRKDRIIELAYKLGDALTQHVATDWSYIPVPGSRGVTVMTHGWHSFSSDEVKNEKTVVLMRSGWMDAVVGSGDVVFEGNIDDARATEINGVSGISPNHVVAVGAHMDKATMEVARAFLAEHPESGFETDYYIGKSGIVKVSLVPIGMAKGEGTLPDIEGLSLRRIVTATTGDDLSVMEAIMEGFIADIKHKSEKSVIKEISDESNSS